jgi:ElaB/YqjD/DUF883 family membrane-anchored ribosome-binding protein
MASEGPTNDPTSSADTGSASTIADDAVRTIEEVRALLAAATPDDLHERAATVRAKLDTALGTLQTAAKEQGPGIVEGLVRGQKEIEREVASVEEQIREHPLDAVLIAAGVGVVIGLLLRRGK